MLFERFRNVRKFEIRECFVSAGLAGSQARLAAHGRPVYVGHLDVVQESALKQVGLLTPLGIEQDFALKMLPIYC